MNVKRFATVLSFRLICILYFGQELKLLVDCVSGPSLNLVAIA